MLNIEGGAPPDHKTELQKKNIYLGTVSVVGGSLSVNHNFFIKYISCM